MIVPESKLLRLLQRRGRKGFRVLPSAESPITSHKKPAAGGAKRATHLRLRGGQRVTVDEYDEAFVDASAAAARLGMALARFEDAVHRLGAATPKCACGWAEGHAGQCRQVTSEQAR
jgi:hypothetical protein